jgi:hypothetical protein
MMEGQTPEQKSTKKFGKAENPRYCQNEYESLVWYSVNYGRYVHQAQLFYEVHNYLLRVARIDLRMVMLDKWSQCYLLVLLRRR